MDGSESFYMFDELNGIIVWELKEGKLIYSLTSDGGINWTTHRQVVMSKSNKKEIQNISFSADGQVTVVCAEKYILESNRKRALVLQSNDFGKLFHPLK